MSDQETVVTHATSAVEKPQKQIIAAFVKFQSSIEGVGKGKVARVYSKRTNSTFEFDYTNIDSILNAIRPVMKECGLAVSFNLITSQNAIDIRMTLYHESGESMVWDGFSMPMSGVDPQEIGSVVTYGKRYQLAAAMGIPLDGDADDDAVRAMQARENAKPKPAKRGSQAVANQLETSETLGEQVAAEIKKELDTLGVTAEGLREAMIKKAKLPAAIVNGTPADWPREWGQRVRKYLDGVKAANARAAKQAAEAEQQEEGEG